MKYRFIKQSLMQIMNSKILVVSLIAVAAAGIILVYSDQSVVYSINSKCEIYNKYIDIINNSESLESANMEFIGYSTEDVQKIIKDAQEKFYHSETENSLIGNVDQSAYQQYITDSSMTMFTEKAIITNDIHPNLKNYVREMLGIFNGKDVDKMRQVMAMC